MNKRKPKSWPAIIEACCNYISASSWIRLLGYAQQRSDFHSLPAQRASDALKCDKQQQTTTTGGTTAEIVH
jgi:hypothetical protein